MRSPFAPLVLAALTSVGCGAVCHVDEIARQEAGPGAVDCGTFTVGPSGQVFPDGGANRLDARGLQCALDAQAASRPFFLVLEEQGVDSRKNVAYARTAQGSSSEFTQGVSGNWGPSPGWVSQKTCASLSLDSNAHSEALVCDAPGSEATACP